MFQVRENDCVLEETLFRCVHGRRKEAREGLGLSWIMIFSYYIFSKQVVFLVSGGKMEFHYLGPPPEKSTMPHPAKNPSDALFFFRWDISVIFCRDSLVTKDISVTCLTAVLKQAVTVLISLYFQTFFQNNFGLWPKKTADSHGCVCQCWHMEEKGV